MPGGFIQELIILGEDGNANRVHYSRVAVERESGAFAVEKVEYRGRRHARMTISIGSIKPSISGNTVWGIAVVWIKQEGGDLSGYGTGQNRGVSFWRA